MTAYDLGLEIALRRFDEEVERFQAIDTKGSIVIGFTGVLVGLQFNIFIKLLKNIKGIDPDFNFLVISTILSSFLSILFSFYSVWVRKYKGGPENMFLKSNAEHKSKTEFEKTLLEVYADSYQQNFIINQRKAKRLILAFVFLSLSIVLTLFSFIKLILY